MARKTVDLEKVKGDTATWECTHVDGAGDAVDLTGAVIRFHVSLGAGETPALEVSTYAGGVTITDAADGEYEVEIAAGLDSTVTAARYCWEVEVTTPSGSAVKTSPGDGTCDLTASSGVIAFSDSTVPGAASVGSILNVQGSGANAKRLVVTATPSTDATLAADELRVDFAGWTTESGVDFELFGSIVQSPDGMSGGFTLHGDIVE